MKIQERPHKRQALFDAIRTRGKYDELRKGMHLSDLLHCNYKSYFRKKGMCPPLADRQILRFELGYAVQYHLFPRNKEEKTYEKDGIICSPDVNDEYLMKIEIPLAEVKTTNKSSRLFTEKIKRDPIKEAGNYLEQIAGYCTVKEVLSADLFVFFIVGDYTRPFTPDLKVWEIEFTKDELRQYWGKFLSRKRALDFALEANELPEPHRYYNWECSWCEVRDLCPKYGEK